MIELNKIYQGDVLEILRTFPDEYIDCVITSPPYFGLRDYGVKEQIGLEPTLTEYLDKMLAVTAELKRVLKKTGTMFWNHGDSYGGVKVGNTNGVYADWEDKGKVYAKTDTFRKNLPGYEKSLLLQNFRLAIRMCDEQGWLMRNCLIWHKPNCMPSPVKDRFTVDFEPVFFFVKNKKYWFETQYEPHESSEKEILRQHSEGEKQTAYATNKNWSGGVGYGAFGRNKRCVWRIPTHPFPEAHFATFPEKLIEPMVKAGCPEFICKKCGKVREKIYKRETFERDEPYSGSKSKDQEKNFSARRISMMVKRGRELGLPHDNPIPPLKELGYTDCGCSHEDGWDKGIVLDPFMGSGTTAVVARKLGRNYIGIELSKDYIVIAERRLAQQVLL